MVAPRIQYATAGDGTRIAYTILGSGDPVLVIDYFTAAGLERRLSGTRRRAFFEEGSAASSLVLFDARNSGLSQSAADFGIARQASDVEAVANHAGINLVDIWALGWSCHVGMEFAAEHPDRVRRMVLARPHP